jgi:hypothetical protein
MIFLKKLFFLILFYGFIFINSFNIFPSKNSIYNFNKIKVIPTSILNFAPQLKLHHIVVIPEYDTKKYNNIYIVDFSPINQTHLSTLFKLLFGYNVPAEIRIRHIDLYKFNLTFDNYINNNNKLIDIWYSTTSSDYIQSQKITDQTFKKIKNKKIKKIIIDIKSWNTSMNLYTHNCQHFSKYILMNK